MEEASKKGKILLVDDTPASIGVVRTPLENAGYDIFVATSGQKALKIARLTAPDIILLDILMPGMDGYETCRCLKVQEETSDIPVIFMSALTDSFDKIRGFDIGAVDYVTKPIETGELLSRIETHLTISRLQRELVQLNAELEERVLARTEALNRANRRLSDEIAERKQTANVLKETKERLSMLLESLPIVAYTCKPEGDFGVTYVGSGIEEITGYKPERFIEKSSFWADHIADEDRKRILGELASPFGNERRRYEYRFRIADGSHRWFDDLRRMVRPSDGKAGYIAGAWRDISEEKRIRQESEYRLQQVIQADKLSSLGEMVAGVAHEINNPAGFITSNLPILDETWEIVEPILADYADRHPEWRFSDMTMSELREDMREAIQAVETGSERINKVILNLKDFSRVNNDQRFKPVNLNEVIDMAFTIVGGQVKKSVGTLELNLAPDPPHIQGHFQKLEQVVINLVVNAVHAVSRKKDGRLAITTQIIERLGAAALSVEDNGIGMAPGLSERIFEPFFTTRREHGGTGLGLSVSYSLVQEHRGIIGVLSRPGIGSRFTVFLPVDGQARLDVRPRILYVGEDRKFLDILNTRYTENRNILVEMTSKPDEVVKRLETHPEVDIVLADITTPGKEIRRATDRIKKRLPLVTVILRVDPRIDSPGEADGLPDHDYLLEKPFSMARFMEIIEKTERQKL